MRFSIVVPVYNVENYIEQCLESIMEQTYQDFELILVDDGSTDRSGKICDEYKECYPDKIRVIHKQNQGVLAARIEGIACAQGEFCIFVDSDDLVEPVLLETVNQYWGKDEEIDVLIYSFFYHRNGKRDDQFKVVAEDGYVWTEEYKREIYEKISCGSDITSIWTKAIRTSILKKDPMDYTLYYGKNMAEDLLQSLYPLTAARKIMYTDKALYNYRINDESISRNFRVETLDKKNTIHVYEKVLEYLKLWNLNDEEMQKKVNAKWFNEAIYIISKSYEFAEDKKSVLEYEWSNLIPDNTFDMSNIYQSESYKKLYSMWLAKDHTGIKRYFFKKKCYQEAKRLKRKLLR